ncbi:MAG: Rha family transcriptional regulator [Lachnospiraceae bacterium]|nr:Rha family transcriptional regulator [Lachnospiraceae bacterium]
MENLLGIVLERKGVPVTTSRKIAKVFGKEHYNVLRDIENLDCSESFNAINFELVNYKDKKGEKRPEYIITKDGFVFLVMGYRGRKAAAFKEAYIKRFNDMEDCIKSAQTAKMDYPALTHAIKETHDEPKSYHFSNELNMINRIVLGTDAKHFKQEHGVGVKESSIRPYLATWQIKAVEALQRADIGLVMSGMDFQSRKMLLTQYFNNCLMPKGVKKTL